MRWAAAAAATTAIGLVPAPAAALTLVPAPAPAVALAAAVASQNVVTGGSAIGGGPAAGGQVSAANGGSLEAAATRAGNTGRRVAVSLIGLALAVAAIVLAFKRDFKEAVGVLAVGLVAVLLASPVGVSVLEQTVSMLFGSS